MILEFIQDLKSSVKIHLKSQWVSSFKDITTAANLRAIRCIVTLRWQLLIYLSHDCFIRAWYVNLGKSSRKWCLQRRNFINNLFYKNKSSAPWGERKVFSWCFRELFIFACSNKPDFPGALHFRVTSRPNYKFSLYQQAEISRKLNSILIEIDVTGSILWSWIVEQMMQVVTRINHFFWLTSDCDRCVSYVNLTAILIVGKNNVHIKGQKESMSCR